MRGQKVINSGCGNGIIPFPFYLPHPVANRKVIEIKRESESSGIRLVIKGIVET